MANPVLHHPASYRDPSGFVFIKDGILYRQVCLPYKEHFDHFIKSGFFDYLVKNGWLIPHEEIKENLSGSPDFYTTLKPEKISFLSWPCEWSFDMLKDAALLTLRLAKEALQYGMVLKDASPYNIQWHHGKLIFIDTLSFEIFREQPWIAYRQFCENFLSPLLLMHYSKAPLHELMLAWPEGIPLQITKRLLPWRSKLSLHIFLHIHLHARYAEKESTNQKQLPVFPKVRMLRLFLSLEKLITDLKLPEWKTAWSHYYREAAERNNYLPGKTKIIETWLNRLTDVKTAADLGANDGMFSKLMAQKNIRVLAADRDAYCINNLYLEIKSKALKNMQPLILDISQPTPAYGVNNQERDSFSQRATVDLVLVLALVHHLAIGKNIPFHYLASFLKNMAPLLIIEFVPKQDEKVQLMLQRKQDIYRHYHEQAFLKAFEHYYDIVERQIIPGTDRILFLMKRHD
jgi:hypothetical protein